MPRIDPWRHRYERWKAGAWQSYNCTTAKGEAETLKPICDRIAPFIWGYPSVADFGCGTGRFFQFFKSVGMEYVGYDILPELKKEVPADATFKIWKGDAIDGDVLFLCGVAQHLSDEDFEEIIAACNATRIIVFGAEPKAGTRYRDSPMSVNRNEPDIVQLLTKAKDWVHTFSDIFDLGGCSCFVVIASKMIWSKPNAKG